MTTLRDFPQFNGNFDLFPERIPSKSEPFGNLTASKIAGKWIGSDDRRSSSRIALH